MLQATPHLLALAAVQLDLDAFDQAVHLRIAETRVVLAGPVVLGGRNLVRMHGRARYRLGRGNPGIHGHGRVFALGHRLAEEHPRRFVLDPHVDADALPLALQHLLHQLARPVAGGGHDRQAQRRALGVVADPLFLRRPAGLVQQLGGALGVEGMFRHVRGMHPIERIDARVGDRLTALEQLLGNRIAVDGGDQGMAHAPVLEDRIVQVEVDMLVDQALLEDDVEALLMAFLERQRLVDRQPQFARDHVDAAGKEVGLERRRVLDHAHGDALEMRFLAPPFGVRLERDMRARLGGDDAVGAEIEPRVHGIRVVGGAVLVFLGLAEVLAIQVRRQDVETRDVVVTKRQLVEVQRERLIVAAVDLVERAIELRVRHPRLRVLADLPGENDVVRRDRCAVAPDCVRVERVGHGDAVLAVRRLLRHRAAVFDGRQLDAQHADQFPIGVDHRDRPPDHAEHVGLGQHAVDVGMKRRRILGDADHQIVLRRPRGQGEAHQGGEGENGEPDHARDVSTEIQAR